MITYSALEDGSLQYESGIIIGSNYYYQDPNDPLHVIPKWRPCEKRVIELRILECGRKRADVKCTHYCKAVSVKECVECVLET
jgi:hypothetical protein